ncbi:MAG TPA: LamG domain-containing protein [Flavisolibacter sp.]|nr:LamG domain-containing protein [Flavisolibacter sp.]
MYHQNKHTAPVFAVLLALSALFTRCTKADKGDDFLKGDAPPVAGGFVNSSEIATANLVAHFPFDGSVTDAKGAVTGGVMNNGGSFTAGRKGQAYTPTITDPVANRTNTFISYSNPGPIAGLTSFTVAMWINTSKHDGGAQGVFSLAKQDGSFWGNFFMMIEGNNSSSNRMFMKLHFEKNNAPFVEHWIEPANDFRPDDMYNGWRHVAWTYDAATSKVGWYINGQKATLPPNAEDRKADNTGTPLGALNFKDATRFVIGGFPNQLGAPFNSPEPWMLPYTGKLDEFRVYNKALNPTEINALSVLERQGR